MLITSLDKYLTNKKGVIHVGGHDGEERDWYISNGFEPVIWFEPNFELFDRLTKNIENYNMLAFNFGIHDTLKQAPLFISSNDGQSSSILELGTHAKYYPDVKYTKSEIIELKRLDTFFEEEKGFLNIKEFNFLNIDVQGVELNVIKSLGQLIKNIDYIYVEVNEEELYKGCSLLPDIDEYLSKYGFVRMLTKMMKSHWGDAFYKRY